MDAVTPIILAGGGGTRLGGVNKALLPIGRRRTIDRLLAAVGPLGAEVVLVSNDESLRGLPRTRIVADIERGAGPLMGLYSGLRAVRTPLATANACDMPFVSTGVLRELLALAADCDVVVPVLGGQPEPLHAVYRVQPTIVAIEAALAAGRRRVIACFDGLRVREVSEATIRSWDPELHSFLNINYPDDLARVQALAASKDAAPA